MDDQRTVKEDELASFCCQNPRCVVYGTRGAGNLKVCGHIGKHKNIRHLKCKTCGKRFSENKGTVFYRSHLSKEKVVAILEHVQEGCGMRGTGRLMRVKEDTVIRLAKCAGEHAQTLHQELVAVSPRTREVQLDEMWAFVRKKQDHCDQTDSADHTRGDCWDHLAMDAEHRLVLGMICGKRSGTRVLALLRQIQRQLQGCIPRLITTDNFGPYETAIELVFGRPVRSRSGGQGQKHPPDPLPPPGLNYATVDKERKNGRVVKVTSRVVFGTRKSVAEALKQSTASTAVNTSFIERYNATNRHRNARKARRTYRFSKDWDIHKAVGTFTCFSYNFCWCVSTLATIDSLGRRQRRTPAMAAALTEHVWTLSEWLSYPQGRKTSQ